VLKNPTIDFNAHFNSLDSSTCSSPEVQLPPRSPDLTPLDFCMWRWMKSEIYEEKVNTRDELVAHIMNNAALLKQERQDDLRRANCTIVKRV
jgi:hypothetical protein